MKTMAEDLASKTPEYRLKILIIASIVEGRKNAGSGKALKGKIESNLSEREEYEYKYVKSILFEREEYEEVARGVEHFATSILAQCRNSQEVESIKSFYFASLFKTWL